MKNLIIIGVGGFAREVYWHAQNSQGYDTNFRIKGFIDGDVKLDSAAYDKLPENTPVFGDIDSYEITADDVFTCAIGIPTVRRKLIEKILSRGAEFINIIGNSAFIVPTAKIGQGVILTAGTYINDHAEVGDFSVVNENSGLGHDAKIGRYTCVMANVNISGGADIGNEVFIAGNSIITPNVKVEDNSYIGAGSVVLKRVRANSKVFGSPAIEI